MHISIVFLLALLSRTKVNLFCTEYRSMLLRLIFFFFGKPKYNKRLLIEFLRCPTVYTDGYFTDIRRVIRILVRGREGDCSQAIFYASRRWKSGMEALQPLRDAIFRKKKSTLTPFGWHFARLLSHLLELIANLYLEAL